MCVITLRDYMMADRSVSCLIPVALCCCCAADIVKLISYIGSSEQQLMCLVLSRQDPAAPSIKIVVFVSPLKPCLFKL